VPEPPSPSPRHGEGREAAQRQRAGGTPDFDGVLAAAQANAGWAFKRLFEGYAPAVLGYLRSQGASDPDGMTNEVFFAAFRALQRFQGDEARFRSWLFTITYNRVIDDRRKQARQVARTSRSPTEAVMPPGGNVEDEAITLLANSEVRVLLDHLTPDQRNVLLLRIVGDLTVAQVASVLGKPQGAVKALQRRALGALARIIESEGVPL
jgi:RNA polymerase sigma factor (sigma-70 family)